MVENWTTSVVIHCKACSMGRVDYDNEDHDHQPHVDKGQPTRLGMSGPEDAVRALLHSWASDTDSHVVDVVIHD